MRIRSHLLLLATVVLVPGFFAAVIAIDKVRQGERDAALRGLRETVRATALLVDGEIQRSLGALTALGASAHLQSGDLQAFYAEAKAIDRPPGVWTLLLDETGTQRVNTAVPFGAAPPPPSAAARVATVLATQRPLVTDVFTGPVTGKLLTTVYLPARPSPAGRFVVAQSFSVDHWRMTALSSDGPADRIVAVIDRQGRFISRSRLADELIGRDARPELVAAAAAAHDGLIRHDTREGIEAYDAFTHSALTGWTIAVAAPVDTIEATAIQSVSWLAAGAVVALLVALIGASILNRTLIRALGAASGAAVALGQGRPPPPLRTSLTELDALGQALTGAGHLLSTEQQARAAAEVQREGLLERERAAREKAQHDNASKDQFLALLGHELRNPLAAIAGATELLVRKGQSDALQRRMLDIVQRQNRHMKHIVDDLLEVSRMLTGKIVLARHPLDLADCVRSCVDALRTTERSKGFRLTSQIEPAWVDGDPVRLEQIINNLVTNALKFSAPGSEVRVRVHTAGANAVVEVADAGTGIGAELLPHIFEPFVQGPAAEGRQASGLGIGLALVRQLVVLHGGAVEARSGGAGKGSTFVITLPRIEAQMKATEPALAGAESRGTLHANCRVLLVEDNADAREATAELLRSIGYEVSEAGDVDAALTAAHRCAPDVVVTDLGMPGKSGHDLAVAMKASPTLRPIPLIALSGYGQARDLEATRAAGFDAHLVKPVSPEGLVAAIEGCRVRAAAG